MSEIKKVETLQAPKPVGPYSSAVIANGFCFVSGQIGIDPNSGKLVDGGIEAEAVMTFQNISAIVKAVGTSCEIVQTEIFLVDLNEFSVVNRVYSEWLAHISKLPARKTVGVVALPLGARIEVSCVVCLH